jgi:hypothetical protein
MTISQPYFPASLQVGILVDPFGIDFSPNASGGTAPYTFSILAGALPAGLSLSSAGAVTGTPTTVGNFSFTLQVADSTLPIPNTAQLTIAGQVWSTAALGVPVQIDAGQDGDAIYQTSTPLEANGKLYTVLQRGGRTFPGGPYTSNLGVYETADAVTWTPLDAGNNPLGIGCPLANAKPGDKKITCVYAAWVF